MYTLTLRAQVVLFFSAIILFCALPLLSYAQTAGYCPNLTVDLEYTTPRMTDATTGGQVSELQKFLQSFFTDYPADSVTGLFGPTTEAYVIRFQTEQGISPAAGYIGAKTRARIAQVCGGTSSMSTTSGGIGATSAGAGTTAAGYGGYGNLAISASSGAAPLKILPVFTVATSQERYKNSQTYFDFGDGSTSLATKVMPTPYTINFITGTHTYVAPGIYTLRYLVYDNGSWVVLAAETITVTGSGGTPAPTPTASLTANGGASATVNATDVVSYKWSSTNGATAATTLTLDAPACGLTGTGPYTWSPGFADSLNGSNSAAPGTCLAGRTVTLTYKVTNSTGQSATSQVVVKVNTASGGGGGGGSTPTASLTANGGSSATVNATDVVNYKWSSTNGASAATTLVLDAPACGLTSVGPHAWSAGFADSLSGSNSAAPGSCLAGRTVTLTYKVTSSTGQSATSQVVVKVNAASGGGGGGGSTPTASITANGASSVTVNTNATINYAWSSTGGASAASTFTLDAPACGLTSTGPFAWTAGYGDSLSGAKSAPAGDCLAGRTITVTYKVTNATGQSATSQVTVKVNAASGGGGGGGTTGGVDRGSQGLLDFGGMYGYHEGGVYANPATGGASCPAGYSAAQMTGSIDYDSFFCYRFHEYNRPPLYDFGGMYGYGYNAYTGAYTYNNHVMGAPTCPNGYTSAMVLGSAGKDYPMYYCYQLHTDTSFQVHNFNGIYGSIANGYDYTNPATGRRCPVNNLEIPAHGGSTGTNSGNLSFFDYAVVYCSSRHTD